MVIVFAVTANRQHWVLWLDGASVAQRTSSVRIASPSRPSAGARRHVRPTAAS